MKPLDTQIRLALDGLLGAPCLDLLAIIQDEQRRLDAALAKLPDGRLSVHLSEALARVGQVNVNLAGSTDFGQQLTAMLVAHQESLLAELKHQLRRSQLWI